MCANQHDIPMTRRSLVKGAGALAVLLPLSTILAACTSEPTTDDDAPAQAGSTAAAAAGEPAAGGSALVAYFSATGTTEGVAQVITEHTGADAFAITPAEPYTDDDLNYHDDNSRTSRERADDVSPALAQVIPDGWEGYDTVYLGYPIWWGSAAWPLKTFVAGNDFTGKTVVPFCTSASSPIARSGEALAEMAGTGEWLDGERFGAGTAADEITAWVDSL